MAAHLNKVERDPVASPEVSALEEQLAARGLPLPLGDDGQVLVIVAGEVAWGEGTPGPSGELDSESNWTILGDWIFEGKLRVGENPAGGDYFIELAAGADGSLLIQTINDDDELVEAFVNAAKFRTSDGSTYGEEKIHLHSQTGHTASIDLGDEPRVVLSGADEDGLLVVSESLQSGATIEMVEDVTLGRVRAANAQNDNELVTLGQVQALIDAALNP